MKNKSIASYVYWFLLLLSFVILPIAMFSYGYVYIESKINNENIKDKTEEIKRFYAELRQFTNEQKFWCYRINSELRPVTTSKTPDHIFIQNGIKELKKTLSFNYVVAHNSKGIIEHSGIIKSKYELRDWTLAAQTLFKRFVNSKYPPTTAEMLSVGRVIGPQTNLDHIGRGTDREDPYLVWADSSFKKPILWTTRIGGYIVMIFIDYKDFYSTDAFKAYLKEFTKTNPSINFVLFNESYEADEKDFPIEIKQALHEYQTLKSQIIKIKNYTIFPVSIRHNLTVLGYIKTHTSLYNQFPKLFYLTLILLLIYTYFFGKYTWNIYIQNQLDSLSIRWKLRFLFFFANGLPILVLLFIGMDYLSQKQGDLLQEKRNRGIEFLQNLDEKLKLQYAKNLVEKDKAKNKFIQSVKKKGLTMPAMTAFHKEMGPYVTRTFIVASESEIIATENGLIRNKKPIIEYEPFKNEDLKHADAFNRIGKYFLAKLNNSKVSSKDETEIELLIESISRKTAPYILYDLLSSRGDFLNFGFGQNVLLSIIDTMALSENSDKQDYFLIAKFSYNDLHHSFLKEAIAQGNRNDLGIRIIALKSHSQSVPAEAYQSQELRDFAGTLTSYPSKELKFLTYKDEHCLAFGLKGKQLYDHSLIGLFPTKHIDEIIETQKNQIIIFAVISLFITFSLSQILALSFTKPLMLITTAASAIADKEFAYRLPSLGNDEFGIMGKIFNNVMVDLEEVSTASTIQNQLLPDSRFMVSNYSVFGKSISLSELGGDYFDFVNTDEGKFGIMLGDVAGHGVGAALIMAMAKAGVINSQKLLDEPKALITRLHQLILASKTKKQRKIMTFQYICCDSENGHCNYSNAGGCAPMVLRRKKQIVEELFLQGSALGAFKRASYDELTLSLEPGDAVIFYTDGLVEARNKDGEELGYDGLKALLLETWDKDAENYYNNIYNRYIKHIESASAEDDLTIIVMVYNPELKASE
jgi:hypothetical protein